MEIFESNIKFTSLYFKIASNVLQYVHDHVYCIWRRFEDNSDKNEWRNRLSMDLVCRFFASLLTGIFEISYFLLQGKDWYVDHYGNSDDSYWISVGYLIISVVVEFIHYIVTFYVVTKVTTSRFTVTNAFMDYITTMTRFHLFVIHIIYFVFFMFCFLY